ncbi:glycosyltransferase family 2 protein [Shewanella waksmanii]|uniref:glycosyltransferase family 2 protein n=1 Tax=Shewanella waksmanii TaxID=213783 RepID=UPI000687B736|nr:glycosyltransferase family 2 protein [Shewanella waksmanii]
MNSHPKISVLLEAYNSGDYLSSQVASILAQRNIEPHILIRDDGSTDGRIEALQQRYAESEQLSYIKNSTSARGHLANFSALCLEASDLESEYFAFSDQDDVWHSNKLSLCYEKLVGLEAKYSSKMPILVHCDLRVVDKKLNEIAPSFIQYQGIPDPAMHSAEAFLHQNVATGCTFVFNRALLELAAPIPDVAVIHDWWFALVAKFYGVIDFIEEPMIDYRQHGGNSIGAISVKQQRSFLKSHIYRALMKFPNHICNSVNQASALLSLSREGSLKHQSKLRQFVSVINSNFILRAKYGFFKLGVSKPFEEKVYFSLVMIVCPFINKK